ncbi:MAG: metallophosphoesterase [Muribaculaceae bacterium]|nr:metallophosphoesterase [Muribaculaceae bacterium]
MSRNIKSLLILLLLTVIPGVLNAAAGNNIRLMSYNIRNANGLDGKHDCMRIAHIIDSVSPDVVAVQELDSVTGRSRGANILAEIAGYTAMHHVYGAAIKYDGGKYGIGVLSKEKPLRHIVIPLPGREESRALLFVEFERYIFACTHMSLTEADRVASLDIINDIAAGSNKPFFIAGDMNSHPDEPFIRNFVKDFTILSDTEGFSFPADKPVELLDYIAVDSRFAKDVTVKSKSIINQPVASDHRPIVVNLMLKQPAGKIISVKPYLQNPVDGGITVMWQTSVPAEGFVEYGTDPAAMKRARTLLDGQADWGTMHKVRLEGLTPGQKYYYRVASREILEYGAYHKTFGDSAVSELKSFVLPAKDQKDFTAIIFNDIHQHSATYRGLLKQIGGVPYDFVVFNGDVIDDPVNHDQATRFLKELNEGAGADSKPVFYIRGNHEIRGAYSVGLRDLFDYVGGKPYSAFSWGDTRFVILDCGEDKPDSTWVYYGMNDFTKLRKDQVEFLKKELASKEFKKAKRRVLLHHAPIYGLGEYYNPCLELWGPLLKNAPFDVSVNAHTHRFAYHPRGTQGNSYPVVIGGGYRPEGATVMILSKKGDNLTLKVLDINGKELLQTAL